MIAAMHFSAPYREDQPNSVIPMQSSVPACNLRAAAGTAMAAAAASGATLDVVPCVARGDLRTKH
eukprot:5813157-Pleurochrysis_carterae.AAC.1